MSARSTAHWKNAEKRHADKLGGVRLNRGRDFSESTYDGESEHFFWDSKSYARHSAMGLHRRGVALYVQPGEPRTFLTILHERGKPGDHVIIDLDDFIDLARAAGRL